VPKHTADRLNEKQIIDYREHRRRLVEWMATRGKKDRGRADRDRPGRKVEGYSEATINRRAMNLDMFYRWVWDNHTDGYTTKITHDHAQAYMDHLLTEDHSGTHKSNLQKTVEMYFRWRAHEFGEDLWHSEIIFSTSQADNPRDALTLEEREKIRNAALAYDSVPHYNALSPEERADWKELLASIHGLHSPDDVGMDLFEETAGYKIASLVCVSLDAGLRPVEVRRAKPGWFDTENSVMRIPVKDSAKNRNNWEVSLLESTSTYVKRWLREREMYDEYDESDAMWLTREGNDYTSTTLGRLLKTLCDEAGIDYSDRQMTWYTIRHSVGTYMAREEGLEAARQQLRHNSTRTTMKYDQVPVEDRRDALRRM
jgi:integrase